MQKVLVTGGAGFIGSHLCEELIKRKNKVICLDNLSVGSLTNLESISNNKNFEFVKGDVRNQELVERLISRVNIIYHLAAVVGVSVVVENPIEDISVNFGGLKTLTEAAYKAGKKKVIFTSSSEVYGKNTNIPLSEDKTDSLFGPTSITLWAYGLSKAIGEHYLLGYAEKGLPVSIVRYFNSYGPRSINSIYANVVPKFIRQALSGKDITVYSDGKQTRTFCYVSDTVEGTIKAAENNSNQIFNIGSDKEIAIKKLAQMIKKISKSKSKIVYVPESKVFKRRFESTRRRVPDLTKAKKILHFTPRISLEKGLEETINWMKEKSV